MSSKEEVNKITDILHKNPYPVISVDKNGTILFANYASIQLLNYFGCSAHDQVPVTWQNIIIDILSTGSSRVIEKNYDDSEFLLTFIPAMEDGEVYIYAADKTKQKNLEKKVSQLEKLNVMNLITAEIAHEVNNPIGALKLCTQESIKYLEKITIAQKQMELQLYNMSRDTEELKDVVNKMIIKDGQNYNGSLTGEFARISDNLSSCKNELRKTYETLCMNESYLREYLENSINESMRCTDIINDLLNCVREKKLSRRWYNINCLITDLILESYKIYEEDKIELVFNLRDNLPEVFVDVRKMELAFTNILNNAIHAMQISSQDKKQTKKVLTIGTIYRQDKRTVEVYIKDTGGGIDEEDINKIFEPFFSKKNYGKGSGLGLNIVKKILAMHDGTINVESKPGKGTTFRINLPV